MPNKDDNKIYVTVHCAYCEQPVDFEVEESGCLRHFMVDTLHKCKEED